MKKVRQEDIAALLNRDRTVVSRLLKGEIKMDLEHAQVFAKALDIPLNEILDRAGLLPHGLDLNPPVAPRGRKIEVKGYVQAGLWAESNELAPDDWLAIDSHGAYDHYRRVSGLQVRGDSMDRRFPPGTILIVCQVDDYGRAPETDDYVVVCRRCADGLHEWTIKALKIMGGETWLLPESTNPRHHPIRVPNGEGEDTIMMDDGRQVEEIRIWGVVVGFHNPNKPRAGA